MAFSLSGSVITQSGTDTNLSGMSALSVSGFTYFESNGVLDVIMNQTGAQLVVNGTLTLPMGTGQLTFGVAAAVNPIFVGNGGTLRLQYAPNGVQKAGFGIRSSHNNSVFWGNGVVIVGSGGLLDLDGSGIYSVGASLNFQGGASFKSRGGVLRGGQVGGTTAMFRNAGGGTTYDIIGLTLIDYTFVVDGTPTFTNLSDLVMQATVGGTNNVAFIPRGTMTIVGPQFLGTYHTHIGTSLTGGAAQKKTVYGYAAGVAPLIGKVPDYVTAVNWVEGRKIINLTVLDTSLSAVSGAITSFTDINNGARYNGTPISATDYTASNTYQATSDGAGAISLDVLLWEVTGQMSSGNTIGGVTPAAYVNSNMVVDYRWIGNSANASITIPLKEYSVLPGSVVVNTDGLAQSVSSTAFLAIDTGVTLSQAAAAALTSVSTLDQLYDVSKNWGCQMANFALPTASTLLINRNGSTLDLGSRNLIIDSAAGAAFAVNTGSNTITIKTATLASGSKFTSLKTTGTVSYASGSTSASATFSSASYLSFANPANVPEVATLSSMTQGLRITAVGTYDLSLWNFSGNTADVTVANSTGAVTIKTGGQSLNITQGTGNTVTIDNTVPYVLNFTITGGTMAAQNLGKFNAFQGVYVSHVAAQAANPTPTLADYYAVDADSNGVREAHGYWTGSAWAVHASAVIAEHEILATSNGGAGVGATQTLNLLQGETWRIYADKVGYYPNMVTITVPTGGGSKDLPLSENPSTIGLSGGDYSSAAALASQASLLPADSNSIMTLLIPDLTGQTANVHYAFVELMRSSLDNARGALAAANAFCVEVDNYIVRLRDDTLRVKPLPAHPPGTRSMFEVPLVLENYTIDLNPVDANGNYVCVSLFPRQVVVGGTVLGRVAIDTADKAEIKNHLTALSPP